MTANDTQVSGSHYKTTYQPWDFMHDTELGYFEGNIVKYTQRHKHKAGAVDLDKAAHYAMKWLELHEQGRKFQNILARLCNSRVTPSDDYLPGVRKVHTTITRFVDSNLMGMAEANVITAVVTARTQRDGYAVLDQIRELRRQAYPNG